MNYVLICSNAWIVKEITKLIQIYTHSGNITLIENSTQINTKNSKILGNNQLLSHEW